MLALCNAESLQRLTAEEVPAVLKQSPSTRAVRRSRTPTAPITRGPEAPRYFSGCPVSPLLASDWTEKGGAGVSPAVFPPTFGRPKVGPPEASRGPGPGRPRRKASGAGEAPSKSVRGREGPRKERKRALFSALFPFSPQSPRWPPPYSGTPPWLRRPAPPARRWQGRRPGPPPPAWAGRSCDLRRR